jgi:rod shape-determining protein MreB
VIQPVSHGRVADDEALDLLLEALLRRARAGFGWTRFFPSATGLLAPPGLSEEERLRLRDVALRQGLSAVRLIDLAAAAAQGSDLALKEPRGQMVVDFGGGKTCVTTLSMGGIVACHWSKGGSQALDEALAAYVEQRYQVRVSLFEAERAKIAIGSVYPFERPRALELFGIQMRSGSPHRVSLDDSEVRDVLADACEPLVQALQSGFRAVPPELASDILREGIVLAGGGALLPGLPEFLEERTGLRFRLARDPINAVMRGALSLLWAGPRAGDEGSAKQGG